MIQKPKRLKRIQLIAVSFLTIAGIVNYIDRSTLSIANHLVSGELHLNGAEMGLLLSAFSLAYAFAQLPVGALLDRFGSRLMLGVSLLVWSCGQLAGGLVSTMNQFLIARIGLGVAEAPLFPAGAKVISDWYAARERGGPTGTFISSTTIAPMIAPPLLTVLMLQFGWRPMFIIMGGVGVVIALAWYAIYRNRDEVKLAQDEAAWLTQDQAVEVDERDTKPTFAEWRNLLTQRNTWGMIIGFMGVIYMVWLFLAWLPAYLEHQRHLSIASTGWLVTIPYVFATIGMASSGYIADALLKRGMAPVRSRKWPVCVGLLGAAACTVPAAYTASTFMAMVYLSAAMFFVNLASGSAWALVSVAAPRRLVASLGSMQNFGGYLGGSAAPIVTGIVLDHTQSFVDALLISAVIAFIAAFVYLFLVHEIRPTADTQATERLVSQSSH